MALPQAGMKENGKLIRGRVGVGIAGDVVEGLNTAGSDRSF